MEVLYSEDVGESLFVRSRLFYSQVKSLFDNQLLQLENLIETQRRAQATMREQKLAADERYKKVTLDSSI